MNNLIERLIYRFVDMLGVLLGIILMAFGLWIGIGGEIKEYFGYFIIFLGLSAFGIHGYELIRKSIGGETNG